MMEETIRRTLVVGKYDELIALYETRFKDTFQENDELVIVMRVGPGFAYDRVGACLVDLRERLVAMGNPFHLFPFLDDDPVVERLVMRLSCMSPAITDALLPNDTHAHLWRRVLGCPVYADPVEVRPVDPPACVNQKRRGLFLTEAQPFHRDHAAIVEAMAEEYDEVIVVVTNAYRSHEFHHPATGGERLEMIKAFLEETAKDRHYLIPFPDDPCSGINLPLLRMLLPPFEAIHGYDSRFLALAEAASIPTIVVDRPSDLRSRTIRERIVDEKPVYHLMALSVHQAFMRLRVESRVRRLGAK